MIMHIDMDAFFASIEQAVNPRLKGKPLIVGSRENKNYTVVCAASYEAKAYGIDSGMLTKQAFALCPHALFVPADSDKYIYTSERIYKLLGEYGLIMEYSSIDEFRLDLQGLGPEQYQGLGEEIKERIIKEFNITCSVGIAKNSLLSKLASKINKPHGLTILNEENLLRVLGSLAVEKLCGIGPSTQTILNNIGINTCLDLWNTKPEVLTRYLGQAGFNLYITLHRSETLGFGQQDKSPKSIGHSYSLTRTIQDQGAINAWLRLLAEMVAYRLRQAGLVSKTTHLWLAIATEKGLFGAQKTFDLATNDGFEVFHRAKKIIAKKGLSCPKIKALGISCSGLSQPKSRPLFKQEQNREDLLQILDSINKKYGEWTIYPACLIFTKSSGKFPV